MTLIPDFPPEDDDMGDGWRLLAIVGLALLLPFLLGVLAGRLWPFWG